jgi:hypothetical protein
LDSVGQNTGSALADYVSDVLYPGECDREFASESEQYLLGVLCGDRPLSPISPGNGSPVRSRQDSVLTRSQAYLMSEHHAQTCSDHLLSV